MPLWLDIVLRLAPLGTMIVGITALIYARRQIQINRENEAKRQFVNFLDECIKYPLLAGNKDGDPIVLENPEQRFRYHWFLSKLLMASESILEITKGDIAWSSTLRENMKAHLPYIRDGHVRFQSYSHALRELITEELAKLDQRERQNQDHKQVGTP
jgi:hypothetical protein